MCSIRTVLIPVSPRIVNTCRHLNSLLRLPVPMILEMFIYTMKSIILSAIIDNVARFMNSLTVYFNMYCSFVALIGVDVRNLVHRFNQSCSMNSAQGHRLTGISPQMLNVAIDNTNKTFIICFPMNDKTG